MRVIRERMVELDFKEEFIEKILKEYSVEKIEEKLDLLMEKRNIQNPAGWLRAALKNDYQDEEQERYDEEPAGESEDDKSRGTMHRALNPQDNKKILSSEEAIRRFKLLRHKLMAMN